MASEREKHEEQTREFRQHIETLEEINEGLRTSFEELSALYRLSETIASAHTLSKVLSLLLEVTGEVVSYDAAVLLLYDERRAQLSMRLDRDLTSELRRRVESQMRDGMLLWALKQGRALVVPDSGIGAWTQAVPQDGRKKSFILVPLIARGKPVGLLNLIVYADEGSFNQRDLSLLSILANQAATSIENAKLYDNIRKEYYDVIRTLAMTVDARDHYTLEHSTTVSDFAVMIAEQMELSGQQVEEIKFGGLLHDIGKIGIPDIILNKPARLTREEFEVMKTHSELGANILRQIDSLSHLIPHVLYHHERFDGTGYPEKLKGKQIPLGARILNVADSFDTITSERVYKKAATFDEGLTEIRRCSETQFDPEIVESFVQAFPRFIERRERQLRKDDDGGVK